jgi:ATP-binding cassette, subfamily B, bacterial PglK
MSFFTEYRNIYHKIPADLKRRFYLVLILVFLAAVADVLSIASILPYLLIVTKPALIDSNILVTKIFELTGAKTVQQFQILCLIVLLCIFLIKNIFVLLVINLQSRFVFKVATRLSEIQIRNYLSLNYTDITLQNSNLIANNSMTLPTAFAHGILNPLISLTSELITLILIFSIIALYNFPLLLAILVIILPVIYFSYRITKEKVKKLGEQRNELMPVTYANLQETVNGFIELKLYNKTELFINRFVKGQSILHQKQSKMHMLNSIPPRIIETSALIAILILSLFYQLTGGSLYSFFLSFGVFGVAIYRLIPSFNRILNSLMIIQNNLYVADKLEFEKQPENEQHHEEKPDVPISFNNEISFKGVSYQYPGRDEQIFKDLDVSIKKGSITGLTGKSGEGKTTFIYLISGIITPNAGKVMIDDIDLNISNTTQWQNHIGFVRHNNFFIDGTILENITLCDDIDLIDKMQLDSAIRNASLNSFIESIPDGIYSRMGESGVKLSEGQKQRIAIARCIYKNASLIIFDEATSAIDINTEAEILENLKLLHSLGKTIIIISHKVSTLSICDDIFLLKDQKIIKVDQPKDFLKNIHASLQ